ncbi:transposase domain-containing protein, partial [Actinoplanes sp. KI2]|uniref:transposase domain-containing protein n=1 Tax=Actinoplanes sp. KI2 TaxID=2983315 RepID=UPI0021D576C1
MFTDCGYRQVWHRLAAGLQGLSLPTPSASALRQARQRLGTAPMRALFELLRGPAATSAAAARWQGLLPVVIDGTVMTIADSDANRNRYVRLAGSHGGSGYPLLRLSALLTCGTRSVLDAGFGP